MDIDDDDDDDDEDGGGGGLFSMFLVISPVLRSLHMLTHILSLEQPCELSAVIFSILWIIKQNITILGGCPRLVQLVNGKGYSLNLIISKQEDRICIQGRQLIKKRDHPSFHNNKDNQ